MDRPIGRSVGLNLLKNKRRSNFDPDLWLIELDIPDAEQLIAEMTAIH
jgi:hypothetical protein